MSDEISQRAREIRMVIRDFIGERLKQKLEKPEKDLEKILEDERVYLEAVQQGELERDLPKEDKLRDARVKVEQIISKYREDYAPSAWLADAAKRVSQIQVVTHPIKSTFPDAKLKEVSSIYVEPKDVPDSGYLTSSVLGEHFAQDVSGNAAALDVNAFLNEKFDGSSIGSLIRKRDRDVLRALDEDTETASELADAFRGITEARTPKLASSSGVKQLFWLAGDRPKSDEDYCLLSPLYPSHLSHRMFLQIQDHRFGEESKKARVARRERKPFNGELIEYPSLAVLKIGGANPQNISQLTSARRGTNYMLSSLPPQWSVRDVRPLWGYPSVFKTFERREETRFLLNGLETFLMSDPPANLRTRTRVLRYVAQLIDALTAFVRPYQELETAWTDDERCNLPVEEKLWLNPYRAIFDDAFYGQWSESAWFDALGRRFATWLNRNLRSKLPVGDVEHRRWQEEFDIDEEWRAIVESARTQRDATEVVPW